jgi:hypothetical protein
MIILKTPREFRNVSTLPQKYIKFSVKIKDSTGPQIRKKLWVTDLLDVTFLKLGYYCKGS